jgi:hypothetical protein
MNQSRAPIDVHRLAGKSCVPVVVHRSSCLKLWRLAGFCSDRCRCWALAANLLVPYLSKGGPVTSSTLT